MFKKTIGAALLATSAATSALADSGFAAQLVEKAHTEIAAQGFDVICPLIRANAEGAWREDDSHVWILDRDHVIVCDGMDVAFEGFDLDTLDDPTGVNIGGVIAELPEGTSVAQWQWQNPATGEVGTQTNHIIKDGDFIIGAGSFN